MCLCAAADEGLPLLSVLLICLAEISAVELEDSGVLMICADKPEGGKKKF